MCTGGWLAQHETGAGVHMIRSRIFWVMLNDWPLVLRVVDRHTQQEKKCALKITFCLLGGKGFVGVKNGSN